MSCQLVENAEAAREFYSGRPLILVAEYPYCPNRLRYSPEVMYALTISALM